MPGQCWCACCRQCSCLRLAAMASRRRQTQWSGGTAGPAGRKTGLPCLKNTQPAPTASSNRLIDITGYEMTDAEPISFLYDSDAAAVRNDGRFVHIDYAPGSMLSVDKQIFELKTAHLHTPSEHWIDGVSFAAELHLVHADADGRLAAVGLLFRLGDPSPAVEAILDAPRLPASTVSAGTTLNAGGFAPDKLGYYQYDGSKTTPPCQEPVTWFVMREPKTISQEQVNRLLALSDGPNNRPVQPTGSRVMVVAVTPCRLPGRP